MPLLDTQCRVATRAGDEVNSLAFGAPPLSRRPRDRYSQTCKPYFPGQHCAVVSLGAHRESAAKFAAITPAVRDGLRGYLCSQKTHDPTGLGLIHFKNVTKVDTVDRLDESGASSIRQLGQIADGARRCPLSLSRSNLLIGNRFFVKFFASGHPLAHLLTVRQPPSTERVAAAYNKQQFQWGAVIFPTASWKQLLLCTKFSIILKVMR
jgi:hypothetical protein